MNRELLVEGMRKFGLTTRISVECPSKFYYGISASRFSEPLDQFDVLMLLSKLKSLGAEAKLLIFVAGRYAQLNGRSREELSKSEEQKIKMLKQTSAVFDIPITILGTADLWYYPEYWAEVDCLKSVDGIIDQTRSGPLFSTVFDSFEYEICQAVSPKLRSALAPIPAPRLYRLFEVAEASYLKKYFGVDAKIGPGAEQEYDSFIDGFMDIVQLQQPVDFRNRPNCTKPITPYIGKDGEERIFVSDSKQDVNAKISKLAQRASGQPILFSGFLNCFVRLSALAVEAAALSSSAPVKFGNKQVSDGLSVIQSFEMMGTDRLTRLAPIVSECLWAYLIRPLQAELKKGGITL
ncbi:MAG: hypothetical protein ABH983_04705 [Candidatus Micrarchaeota archaeon]